jgi:hypothetical protein
MSTKITSALTFLLLLGSFFTSSCQDKAGFIEFVNTNDHSLSGDGTVFTDKQFSAKVPSSLRRDFTILQNAFFHLLEFDGNSKILYAYIPELPNRIINGKTNITKKQLLETLKDDELLGWIEEKKLIISGRFGIRYFDEGRFSAIYFNVARREVKNFDYSLTTIQLK